jgi:hypothetical protein
VKFLTLGAPEIQRHNWSLFSERLVYKSYLYNPSLSSHDPQSMSRHDELLNELVAFLGTVAVSTAIVEQNYHERKQ